MLNTISSKLYFVGLTFLLLSTTALSQDSLTTEADYIEDVVWGDTLTQTTFEDTLKVEARNLDSEKLQKLKTDKDFDYSQSPIVGESLWERFLRWMGEFINKLLRGAVNTNWGRVLLYAACLIVLIMIVLALLKVDAFKVLFKGADSPSVTGVFHENIHEMDFEKLIREATEKGDYRNAVRLVFLYSLKLLSDHHHIHWQPGKTNHDYLDELKIIELKTGLGELSFYFDYAWYGGFAISSAQFDRVKNIFSHWRSGIR